MLTLADVGVKSYVIEQGVNITKIRLNIANVFVLLQTKDEEVEIGGKYLTPIATVFV